MLTIISPAKTMAVPENRFDSLQTTLPVFADKALFLAAKLRQMQPDELGDLMKISPKLAYLTYERYRHFMDAEKSGDAGPAIFLYQGDTYKGLGAPTFSPKQLAYAQDHLRILSGLYGLVRPLDVIKPYRLEMGTSLAMEERSALYGFWQGKITARLHEEVVHRGHRAVINLASREYATAVEETALGVPFITCHFKEQKNGALKTIGLYAKKARGMMAKYILCNQIEEPVDLKAFSEAHYRYANDLSSDTEFVFVRNKAT